MFRINTIRSFGCNRNLVRLFSTNPDHLTKWQASCWKTYLSSGRGSDTLFRAIDSNHTFNLAPEDIRTFLDSVGHKGVHPRAFKILDELAHDHGVSLAEFKSWLVIATKFGAETNSEFSKYYERHPDIGDRRPQADTDDYHSLNEVTMNQGKFFIHGTLRRSAENPSKLSYAHFRIYSCSTDAICCARPGRHAG